ncbi:Helix-turn-helix domain-containing protein [bacterium A37T11]|nr:Helix-turn-helix domain-containing protein [bacterium A37T11]
MKLDLIPPSDLLEKARELVTQSLAHIGTLHSCGVPTVSRVAQALYTKPRTLRYLYRLRYQQSFHTFIQEQRLETSKRLLRQGIHVSSVANLLEYSAPQNFARAFKRTYKVTPSNYILIVGIP